MSISSLGVETHPNARQHARRIVQFTDGIDTYSWLSKEQLTALVEQSHAVVYAIYGSVEPLTLQSFAQHPSVHTERWKRAWRAAHKEKNLQTEPLRELTKTSGGRLIEASEENFRDVFMEVLEEMSTHYLLTYVPSGVDREGWHEIEVKLAKRSAEIRARRGYFIETPNPKAK